MAERIAILGLLFAWLPGPQAAARIPLCVEVRAPAEEQAGLEKLVQVELGHHESHRPVAVGCRATLTVELFQVTGRWQLTARIDQQIPVRYQVPSPDDLAARLRQALSLVLHNEPTYLTEDITPAAASSYYLVVPRTTNEEGSYGVDSAGTERPVGTATCVATQVITPCP